MLMNSRNDWLISINLKQNIIDTAVNKWKSVLVLVLA